MVRVPPLWLDDNSNNCQNFVSGSQITFVSQVFSSPAPQAPNNSFLGKMFLYHLPFLSWLPTGDSLWVQKTTFESLSLKTYKSPIRSHGPALSFRALPNSCLCVYGSQTPNPSLFNGKATNPVLDWHEVPTTLGDVSGHSRRLYLHT